MLPQPLRKRRKDCSAALFVAFVLGYAALITLPGFLYWYFWEGAGFIVSTLIGFLIGNLVMSLLEGVGSVIAAVRRMIYGPARSKQARTESPHGADDSQP